MKPKIILTIKMVVALAIFAWYGVFLAHKIDLTTADLGRHIQNGNVLIHGSWAEKWAVLHTNFYSYTLPNEPFINHHWGSGVVFYVLWKLFGFTGLSVFYVLLGLATLWLFFDVARKASNFWIAAMVTIAITPLITSRAEVRPEMFTYLFTGVFFWVLWQNRFKIEDLRLKNGGQTSPSPSLARRGIERRLWILPVVMLVWVNLHIGFVFGFLVLGAFGLEQLFKDLKFKIQNRGHAFFSSEFKQLLVVGVACVVAGLVNPSFLNGFLYPLHIFSNYGYLIVENQSIKFLENISFTAGQHFLLFKIAAGLSIAFCLAAAIKNWRKIHLAELILVVVTAYMAYTSIRSFPSFAFFALPAIAGSIYSFKPARLHPAYAYALGFVGAAVMIFVFSQQYTDFVQIKPELGFGLLPGVNASADFFNQNGLQGPIFNNYDIGGYLIFELNTDEHGSGQPINTKIFVDNRPEAYTPDFFQKIYEAAQTDPVEWNALDSQYHFNAIFFSYRDYTPWAQTFLIGKVNDPAWAPVYVDSYNIIFLKRNAQNGDLIKKYELPKSTFGITTQ